MTPHLILLLRAVVLLACAFTFSGCVTRGYKLADKNTPPPIALNFTSAEVAEGGTAPAPAQVRVETVIIFGGPGSWKREAYWDEYVLTITNRSEAPLVVTGATLNANNGESSAPGENPWKIERIGKTWWQSNAGQQTKTYLMLGGGAVTGAGVALVSAFGGVLSASSSAVAGVALGAATFYAMPLVAIGSVGMNLRRKHRVEAEFTRRRLVLPLTIAPGQIAQGSLFFRITPSPRELVVHCDRADARHDVRVDLAPLVGLHMRMPIVPAKPESR